MVGLYRFARREQAPAGGFQVLCLLCLVAEIALLSIVWFLILPAVESDAARRSSFSVFIGKDRRLKVISPSFNSAPGDTYLSDGAVSVTLISPVNYKLRKLDNGDPYYLDRTYTAVSIPGNLRNKIFIVGNDDDRMNASSNFVQFEISDTARISVFIDSNALRPGWLPSGYIPTGRYMTTTDPVVPVMKEYRQLAVPRSTIRFGGMDAANSGAQCNYVVCVRRPAPGDLGSPEQLASTQMRLPRVGHRITLLDDGKVLVTGGHDSFGAPIMECELYDSASQSFSPTGSLISGRINPAVVKLNDGRVLALGGDLGGQAVISSGAQSARGITALSSCELYDPATGLWSATGSMGWNRRMPEAIKLQDGRIFVSGGVDDTGGHGIPSTELYDPATGVWTAGPGMLSLGPYSTTPGMRYGHRMALLPDGRVLIAGGLWHGPDLIDYGMSKCEIFDPVAGTMSPAADMQAPRGRFELIPIGNGRYMAIGGLYYQVPSGVINPPTFVSTAAVQIYDAASGWWSAAASLPRGAYDMVAISPDPERVLVFAGYNVNGTDGGEVLLYDGIFNNWTSVGMLVRSRSFPFSTGSALVTDVGGKDFFLCGGAHYDESTGQTEILYTGERFKY